MVSSKITLAVIIFSTFLIAMSSPMSVYAAGSVTILRAPPGYNSQTGGFTLSTQLTKDYKRNERGGTCVMFDYFILNAAGGQTLQAQAGSQDRVAYYIILQSPNGLYLFENSNCGSGYWGVVQGFTSTTTINLVAPESGQFVIIFLTHGFYGGTLFFTLQAM